MSFDLNEIYKQLTPIEALKLYCDWLLIQQDGDFFNCREREKDVHEWYMVFYPIRTLLITGVILKNEDYLKTAEKYVDTYITEQLPNGAFTSNYRRKNTKSLSKSEFFEILRNGKVNLADNGSNVMGIIQAAACFGGSKKNKYINAAKKWLDNWVPIWALPEGGYGNGIWCGHKLNSPYTCAMANVSTAMAAFSRLTGEREYIENAEKCMEYQCSKWMDEDDGRPINLDCYPSPFQSVLTDFGHSFYLMEGLCWTHSVSDNNHIKSLIESRLKQWIFGEKGLLSQWTNSWFDFMAVSNQVENINGKMIPSSRNGIRIGWEMAKSNGIIHAFLYYLNHIEENEHLRKTTNTALSYLSNPLKARMSGVMSDPNESYGAFSVQATGFAGLSLAEAVKADIVFSLKY